MRKSRLFTILLLLGSLTLAASAAQAQPRAYVANLSAASVSVLDTSTNTVIATVPVGPLPRAIALSPDGAVAYVVNSGGNPGSVSVIDTQTLTVTATVPVGVLPVAAGVRGDGAFAYVANNNGDTVSVIDAASQTLATTVTVGVVPQTLAVTPDGASVWVPSGNPAQIFVIDAATNTVATTFPQGFGLAGAVSIAFTPDGAFAYLVNVFGNTVSVMDAVTHATVATVPTTRPFDVAITPDGAFAYVVNILSNTVSVIDTATHTVVDVVPVGTLPRAVAITPDGAFAYVSNFNNNNVSVIDTATRTVTATIPVGLSPWGIAISPACPGVCVPPPAGLQGWWPGDRNADDLEDANDGTLIGGAGFTAGMAGQAFLFDGVDDYVSVPDDPALDLTTALTLDAWVRADDPANGDVQAFVSKPRIGGSTGYRLGLNPAGRPELGLNSGFNCSAAASAPVAAGVWTHVAGTWDGVTGEMKVYVDGQLAGSLNGCAVGSLQNSAEPVQIGREFAILGGRYFDGTVDEVEIFDRVLSAAEIDDLYQAGAAGKCKAGALLEQLITLVESLGLQTGIENSLVSKLENAIASFEMGNTGAAGNKIEAFIHQLEALSGKKIDSDDADLLIQQAEEVLDVLNPPACS